MTNPSEIIRENMPPPVVCPHCGEKDGSTARIVALEESLDELRQRIARLYELAKNET